MPYKATDAFAGFVAAVCAPALIAGLIAVPFSPVAAILVLYAAAVVALMHVMLLAVPLYLLIGRWWTPGPVTILVSAALIGALPVSFLSVGRPTLEVWPLALFGLAGGCAFLVFANRGPVEAD